MKKHTRKWFSKRIGKLICSYKYSSINFCWVEITKFYLYDKNAAECFYIYQSEKKYRYAEL